MSLAPEISPLDHGPAASAAARTVAVASPPPLAPPSQAETQAEAQKRSAAVDASWDDAFVRVESYLRAHQIESRMVLNRLVNEIIEAAAQIHPTRPGVAPVTLAIEVAENRIGAWLVRAMGEGDWSDDRFRARGRLALLMSDTWRRWPDKFLDPGPIPPEISEAMQACRLQAGPELRFANMPPAPLEFPFDAEDGKTWQTLSRSTLVVAASSWLVIAGLIGAAWAVSHGS